MATSIIFAISIGMILVITGLVFWQDPSIREYVRGLFGAGKDAD